jgi:hypothetical protein
VYPTERKGRHMRPVMVRIRNALIPWRGARRGRGVASRVLILAILVTVGASACGSGTVEPDLGDERERDEETL